MNLIFIAILLISGPLNIHGVSISPEIGRSPEGDHWILDIGDSQIREPSQHSLLKEGKLRLFRYKEFSNSQHDDADDYAKLLKSQTGEIELSDAPLNSFDGGRNSQSTNNEILIDKPTDVLSNPSSAVRNCDLFMQQHGMELAMILHQQLLAKSGIALEQSWKLFREVYQHCHQEPFADEANAIQPSPLLDFVRGLTDQLSQTKAYKDLKSTLKILEKSSQCHGHPSFDLNEIVEFPQYLANFVGKLEKQLFPHYSKCIQHMNHMAPEGQEMVPSFGEELQQQAVRIMTKVREELSSLPYEILSKMRCNRRAREKVTQRIMNAIFGSFPFEERVKKLDAFLRIVKRWQLRACPRLEENVCGSYLQWHVTACQSQEDAQFNDPGLQMFTDQFMSDEVRNRRSVPTRRVFWAPETIAERLNQVRLIRPISLLLMYYMIIISTHIWSTAALFSYGHRLAPSIGTPYFVAISSYGIVSHLKAIIDRGYGRVFPWPPPNPLPNVEANELIVEAHAEA
jgi:hypothetical protein